MNEVSAYTHLESNSEHQHSKDKSPEGPVPKHLRGRDRKMSVKHHSCAATVRVSTLPAQRKVSWRSKTGEPQ